MTRFDELNEELRAVQQKYKTAIKELFLEEAVKLLERYPKVPDFGWTQYAPYFNDGEPCYFRVHADNIHIYGMNIDYEDYEAFEDYFESEEEFNKFCKEAIELVAEVDEDVMEEMFGHGLVTVERDGTVTTEPYDHD